MVIIERRIGLQSEGQKQRLLEQFETLTAAVWSILLDGALGYLTVICERDHLPLGSEHVFVQELKTLHDAENTWRGRYEKHLVSAQWSRGQRQRKSKYGYRSHRNVKPGLGPLHKRQRGSDLGLARTYALLDPGLLYHFVERLALSGEAGVCHMARGFKMSSSIFGMGTA